MALSPLNLDLAAVAPAAAGELAGFLRKANRPLRQASLTALDALVNGHSKVGRCRLTRSKPMLNAPMVPALEATM